MADFAALVTPPILVGPNGGPANGDIFARTTSTISLPGKLVIPFQAKGKIKDGVFTALDGSPYLLAVTPEGGAIELVVQLIEDKPGGGLAKHYISRTVAVPNQTTVTWDALVDVVPVVESGDYVLPPWASELSTKADNAIIAADLAVAALETIDQKVADVPTPAQLSATIGTEITAKGAARSSDGFVTLAGTVPGSVPVAKAAGDARAAVWEFTHNSETGYLYHLLAGASMAHTSALIALGVDNDGIGILLPNKKLGRGIVGDQRATITNPEGYWLHATQRSSVAPLVRLEMQASDSADVLQLLSFGGGVAPGAEQNLLNVGTAAGSVGRIYAADGRIRWRRDIEVQDLSDALTSKVSVYSQGGTAAGLRSYANLVKSGLELYTSSGSSGTWWPAAIRAAGSSLYIEAGPTTSAVGTAARTTLMRFQNGKIGFWDGTPVARPAGVAVTPEAIHAALVSLGLIAA